MDEAAKNGKAEDTLVVTLIGHGNYDGQDYKVNIPGADMTAAELKPLAEDIYGRIPRRGDLKVRAWPSVKSIGEAAEVVCRDPKVSQSTWSRNWLGVKIGHPDAAALQVKNRRFLGKLAAFLKAEGAAALVKISYRDGMLVHGEGYDFQPGQTLPLPAIELAQEDYRRLVRLVDARGRPSARRRNRGAGRRSSGPVRRPCLPRAAGTAPSCLPCGG